MSGIYKIVLLFSIGVFVHFSSGLTGQELGIDQRANERLKELSKSASAAIADGFYLDAVNWFNESGELKQPARVEESVWVDSMILFSYALLESGNESGASNNLLKIKTSGFELPIEYYRCLVEVYIRQKSLPEAISTYSDLFSKQIDLKLPYQFEEVESYLSVLLENGDFANIEKWFAGDSQQNFLSQLRLQDSGHYLVLNLIRAEAANLSGQFSRLSELVGQLSNFRLTPHQLWSIRYLEFIATIETENENKTYDWNEKIRSIGLLAKASGNTEAIWKTALAQSKAWLILKEYAKARQSLIPLLEGTVTSDIRGEALLNIAQTFLSENKFEQALSWLKQYSGSQSDTQYTGWVEFTNAQIYFRRYQVLLKSGDSLEALNALKEAQITTERVVNLIPGSDLGGYARFQLGWCLLESGKLIPAREEFEAAFSLFPPGRNQLEALVKVGEIHLALNLYNEAIESFTSAENLFEKFGYDDRQLRGRLKLAQVKCFIGDKRLDTARSIVLEMVKNNPNQESSIEALLNYSQQLVQLEEPDTAIELLNEAMTFSSSELLAGMVQENIIYALSKKQEWEKAVEKAEDWIAKFSQHRHLPDVMYQLCYLTLQTQGRNAAIHRFNQFVSKFPDHEKSFGIHFWIAQYFYDEGEFQNALRSFDIIIRDSQNSDSPLVHESKIKSGICFSRLGQHSKAASLLTGVITELDANSSIQKTNQQNDVAIRAHLALADVLLNDPELGDDAFNKSYEVISDLLNKYGEYKNTHEVRAFAGRLLLRNVDTSKPEQNLNRLSMAESYFNEVLKSEFSSNSLKAEAGYGLAKIDERRALMFKGDEKLSLLRKSSTQYRKVFYSSPESVNVYWIKKAGISAYKIATMIGSDSEVESINKRFKSLFGVDI